MATIEEIKKLLEPINEKLDNMATNIMQENKLKFEELEQKIEARDKKIEYLENKIREKNLIFFGIKERENEKLERTMIGLLREELKLINIDINNIELIKRIGKFDNKKTRPVLIEFNAKRIKTDILRHAKLLKQYKIYIEEDYTSEVLQDRRKLKPHFFEARNNGHKAVLIQNNLYIDGDKYTAKDFNEEPAKSFDNFLEKNQENLDNLRRKSISLEDLTRNQREDFEERSNTLSLDIREKPNTREEKKKKTKNMQPKIDELIKTRMRTKPLSKN